MANAGRSPCSVTISHAVSVRHCCAAYLPRPRDLRFTVVLRTVYTGNLNGYGDLRTVRRTGQPLTADVSGHPPKRATTVGQDVPMLAGYGQGANPSVCPLCDVPNPCATPEPWLHWARQDGATPVRFRVPLLLAMADALPVGPYRTPLDRSRPTGAACALGPFTLLRVPSTRPAGFRQRQGPAPRSRFRTGSCFRPSAHHSRGC